jgi:hypothetical protein
MSASEPAFPPVSGAGTTETLPSSVASIDPPILGVFQAQATVTAPIVATTPSVAAPALQTRPLHYHVNLQRVSLTVQSLRRTLHSL